jgi:peptide-methionine (S)-S-oxide reductase
LLASPTYQQVCTDRTGHAEAVEIDFDPSKISYQQLLDEFFALHDPTQLNRQGPDWGSQYRSVVFYRSPEQEKAAKETIARLTAEKRFSKPVVTQVVPAETFWRAEDYHQKYLEKRGAVSCHI